MTRPTLDDLDEYDRKGHRVAAVPPNYITNYPSLGMHLLAALAEAERLGLTVVDGEILIPLTEEELADKVKSAQRSWDLGKEMHDQYLKDGVWPRYDYLWNAYLKAEGIDKPTKEEVASERQG